MPVVQIPYTIASGTVSGDLTAFPVMVDLADMPAAFWANVAAGGSDIRVWVGLTSLPIDLVVIDIGTETGRLFFRADLLAAADNEFQIACGTGDPAPAASDPIGRNACWSSYHRAFAFVGNSGVDRCGSGDDVVVGGTTAIAGGVLQIGGTTSYAYCACSQSNNFYMGVIHGTGTALVNEEALDYGRASDRYVNDALLLHRQISGAYAMWNPTDQYSNGVGPSQSANARRHISMGQTGTAQRRLWTGGVLRATDPGVAQFPNGSSGTRLWIGCSATASGNDRMTLPIEMAWLRHVDAPAAWVAAEAACWIDPSSFATVGPPVIGGDVTGDLDVVEADDVLAATGSVPIVGALAATEDGDTLDAAGEVAIFGALSVTEGDDALIASAVVGPGVVGSLGELSLIEDGDLLAATGTVDLIGDLAATEDDDMLVAFARAGITGPFPIRPTLHFT